MQVHQLLEGSSWGAKWWEMREEDKQVGGQWSAQKHPEWWMMMARHNRRHLSPSAELVCTICHKYIWGNLLRLYVSFWFTITSSLDASPAGWGVWLPRVRFVREQISAACSFHKHRSSCLHVAICEAGVQRSFDFVSHIQTERGLHLFSQRQRRVPLGPGAYLTQVRQQQHICTQPNGQR